MDLILYEKPTSDESMLRRSRAIINELTNKGFI